MSVPNARSMKRPPAHPGEMLHEDFLPEHALTEAHLAKALGVSRQSINELLRDAGQATKADVARIKPLRVAERSVAAVGRATGSSLRSLCCIEQLTQRLFGASTKDRPGLLGLRYQLLTACARALSEAEREGCSRAIMLVHEFITSKTTDAKHARKSAALLAFVNAISGTEHSALAPDTLYGAVRLPGLSKASVELFVGKVSRNLRGVGPSAIAQLGR